MLYLGYWMSRSLTALAVLSAAGASAPAAAQSAFGSAGVNMVQPAGITVVQDVLTKVNAAMIVTGSPGDSVSLAVPSSVEVSSAVGQVMTVGTLTELSATNLVLGQDSISVSVGALVSGQSAGASPGTYGGVMVVLAQYN